jgi:hypothetical protein
LKITTQSSFTQVAKKATCYTVVARRGIWPMIVQRTTRVKERVGGEKKAMLHIVERYSPTISGNPLRILLFNI